MIAPQARSAYILFLIAGIPFKLPISWLVSERCQISNAVQNTLNAQLAPAVVGKSNSITINLEIPHVRRELEHLVLILKSQLLKYSELWGSFSRHVHDKLSPISQRIPFTGISLPSQMPLLVGYMGANNYVLAGIIVSFSSSFNPHKLVDEWMIQLEAMNVSIFRNQLGLSSQASLVPSCGIQHIP